MLDIHGETPQERPGETPPAESSAVLPEATPSVEELQSVIQSLRAELGKVNAESAQRRHAINDLMAKTKSQEEAEMTAVERLLKRETELAAMTAQVEELAQARELDTAVIRAHLESTVKSMNVPDYVMEAISGQTAAQQLQFINDHRDQFGKQPTPVSTDATKEGSIAGVKHIEDLRNKSPEWIRENWEQLRPSLINKR